MKACEGSAEWRLAKLVEENRRKGLIPYPPKNLRKIVEFNDLTYLGVRWQLFKLHPFMTPKKASWANDQVREVNESCNYSENPLTAVVGALCPTPFLGGGIAKGLWDLARSTSARDALRNSYRKTLPACLAGLGAEVLYETLFQIHFGLRVTFEENPQEKDPQKALRVLSLSGRAEI